VNWQHLKTIAWLRWRLTANQWKKGGSVNAILWLVLVVAALIAGLASLFVSFTVGLLLLPQAEPDHLLVLWDVLVLLFLFFWGMGLVTELQRSEVLSLGKLLHLPVSLSGTFLMNYLSSLLSLSLVVFVPATFGLSVALVIVKGPALLMVFPLLATFLLMVTGVTHQLREWLHVLMLNKRRRRAIIAFVATAFILVVQIPNIINMMVDRGRQSQASQEHQAALLELQQRLATGELSGPQYSQEVTALEKRQAAATAEHIGEIVKIVAMVNAALPVGWLPYGVRAAAAGSIWPGLLGALGALSIGCWSLWRSYRTVLRYYTGGFGTGERKKMPSAAEGQEAAANFLERRIRWVPDPAAAVALAGFRSLMRAPEGKMLLISPFILMGLFSMGIFRGRMSANAEVIRPLLGLGAVSITMLCFIQLFCNAFGTDRAGFRALVLSPCRRRDILLGKNLAFAPLTFGVCLFALVMLQLFRPMQGLHFVATLLQMAIGFVLCCLLGNVVSIFAPSAVTAGSLKPAKARLSAILMHVAVALLSPAVFLPGVLSLGGELLLDAFEVPALIGVPIIPVYLVTSILEGVLVAWLYGRCLDVEGKWLQRREQAILETVTRRVE
jgi:ABC-2 type transport system permease protein